MYAFMYKYGESVMVQTLYLNLFEDNQESLDEDTR